MNKQRGPSMIFWSIHIPFVILDDPCPKGVWFLGYQTNNHRSTFFWCFFGEFWAVQKLMKKKRRKLVIRWKVMNIQRGLSMMFWLIHIPLVILVDPYLFIALKECGSTKTSLTVHTVQWSQILFEVAMYYLTRYSSLQILSVNNSNAIL